MKNKIIKTLLLILSVTLSLGLFTACGGDGDGSHKHDYSILKFDVYSHWYECSCFEKSTAEDHKGGQATCAVQAVCEVCSFSYGNTLEHNYTSKVTQPTCTTKGYTTYTCIDCGYSYDGTYVDEVHDCKPEFSEPTCTEMGYTKYVCDCGYVDEDKTQYVNALYHDFGEWEMSPEGALYKVCSRDETHVYYKSAVGDELAVLYSAHDKMLDLPSLKRALSEQDVTITSLADIDSYIVNGETVTSLDLKVTISNTDGGFVDNYGHDRTVAIPQTVTLVINGVEYTLNSVYAYTKIIDEAEDLKYFTMDKSRRYNATNGYFIVTKDIDATNLELDAHVFENGTIYPGNGYNMDVGFKGVLDGQGHTIDGLTTKSNGLFGYANAPVIKNIAFTNITIGGYYATLFAHGFSRGKNPDNSFNGYEGLFENIYVSVKSITPGGCGRVGILSNNVLPAAHKKRNVVVEYLNIDSNVQNFIDNGGHFYMIGASNGSMAGSITSYSNCYAITTAPVLSHSKTPGFAENQVEYTIVKGEYDFSTGKVGEVGEILDRQVKTILSRNGLTLSVGNVLVGLRVYDTYEDMSKDSLANTESLATFDSKYWTIVNGVPYWNFKTV